MYFMFLLFIFLVSFAHAGYLAFAAGTFICFYINQVFQLINITHFAFLLICPVDVYDFRNFSSSLVSVFMGVFGYIDYDSMEKCSRYYAPVYFFVFQVWTTKNILRIPRKEEK